MILWILAETTREDYAAMQEKIFGRRPTFGGIAEGLRDLEQEINFIHADRWA